MNIAFIFPGQGSQTVGMGKDFCNSEPVAKRVFQIVDDTLGYSLSHVIFNGPIDELSITTNTQPALMAVSIAILRVLQKKSGKKINQLCQVVAGHSVGEYSALCAANSLSLEDTTKLLQLRARSIQEASPKGEGAMAACIGVTSTKLQELLDLLIDEGICQIANDNIEEQIVISGHEYNIDRIIGALKDTGHKAIKLNVSAPCHSNLIKKAEIPMGNALKNTQFNSLDVPIIANISAKIVTNITQTRKNLLSQICGTVRWRETLDKMKDMGITDLVEIGSGRVLSGLAKKSSHGFITHNISSIKFLSEFLNKI